MVYPPTGSTAYEREMSTLPTLLLEYDPPLPFYTEFDTSGNNNSKCNIITNRKLNLMTIKMFRPNHHSPSSCILLKHVIHRFNKVVLVHAMTAVLVILTGFLFLSCLAKKSMGAFLCLALISADW